jgi:O-antigen/teichoic acid export membrane protein
VPLDSFVRPLLTVRNAFIHLGVQIRLALDGQFLRSVVALVSAGAIGQGLLLATMPIVARLYTPSEFGLFAAFSGVMATLLVASSLRYELAIPLPTSDRVAQSLLRLSLFLTTAMSIISAGAVFLWRGRISALLGLPELAPLLWALPIVLFAAGTHRVFLFWALRRGAISTVAYTKVVQSSANAAVQLGAGFTGIGAIGLIAGQLVGFVVGTLRLARGAHFLPRLQWSDARRMLALAKRYSRFPKYDVPAAVVDTLSVQLPNIALAALFNPAAAGLFMLADRALGVPLSLIGQAIGQVFYSRSRATIAEGRVATVALNIVLVLSGAMAVPVFVIFVWGAPLFEFIFGTAWREAGVYASWLMLGIAAQFIYSSISLVLSATNGQHLNFAIHIGMLAAKALSLWWGYHSGSALTAVIGYALVNCFGYLASIAIVVAHAKKFGSLRKLDLKAGRT